MEVKLPFISIFIPPQKKTAKNAEVRKAKQNSKPSSFISHLSSFILIVPVSTPKTQL